MKEHTPLPSLLFFVGLAGAGKTFAGTAIASRLHYHCYDLDLDLTAEMKAAILEKRSFTQEMRDRYFEIICNRISELRKEHPHLVVMQAAYKECNRAMIRAAHPDVQFIWVTASDENIINRLRGRGDDVTPDYAQVIARNFEAPQDAKILENDDCDEQVLFDRFLDAFRQSS